MRILIVGGTGTIGQAVVKELQGRHTVLTASRAKGDFQVDIADRASIEKMYQAAKNLDAVIATTGAVHFAELSEMSPENYSIGLNSKLMGQVNLVLLGQHYLNEKGSFTLTSGLLSQEPIRAGSSASMVNAGLEGFVRGAAVELPKGLRINVVSPTIITESLPSYGPYFRGFESVSAARAALAYSKSVEGVQTGQVYRVGW